MATKDVLRVLSSQLNSVFVAMITTDGPLRMLPQSSWVAKAQPGKKELRIEVLRNEYLRLSSYAPELSSEMYWYELIIPLVARALSKQKKVLKKDMIVRFVFRSESGERLFSCNALELASEVENISGAAGFGRMMSLMDTE